MDAYFACTSNDTNGVPTWKIANHVFASSALPPRYSYNGSGLVISNVDLSLNTTSYSCFFIVYVTEGQFVDIESTTGFLYITGLHSIFSWFHGYFNSFYMVFSKLMSLVSGPWGYTIITTYTSIIGVDGIFQCCSTLRVTEIIGQCTDTLQVNNPFATLISFGAVRTQ